MWMLTVLAAVAALSTTAVPPVQTCDHTYNDRAAVRGLRAALKHHQPMTDAMGARAWRYVNCARDRKRALRLHGELRRWRRSYRHVWWIRLHTQPQSWVEWAKMITFRESRWDQHACDYVSCTHYSYFQWALSTWYAAGGTGHPYNASWPHQAVLAIRYARSGHLSAWALTN